MRSLGAAWIFLLLSPALALAQTSAPASQPSNGLAMTDAQIHARLEALNAHQAGSSGGTFDAAKDLANRRAIYLQNEQAKLDQAARDDANDQAAIAAANQQLPLIQAQLPALQAQANAANSTLQNLIQARDDAINNAINSSNGTFQGQGVDPNTGQTIDVTGTISDPAAAGIETQLINTQFAPQIQAAQQQADALNGQLNLLQQQAQRLAQSRQSAVRDHARATNAAADARGAVTRALSATTMPDSSMAP